MKGALGARSGFQGVDDDDDDDDDDDIVVIVVEIAWHEGVFP